MIFDFLSRFPSLSQNVFGGGGVFQFRHSPPRQPEMQMESLALIKAPSVTTEKPRREGGRRGRLVEKHPFIGHCTEHISSSTVFVSNGSSTTTLTEPG